MDYEKILPREVWEEVLEYVSLVDLCSVVLTSSHTHMKNMASWADLWVAMPINTGKLVQNGLPQLYTIDRFKRVSTLNLSGIELDLEQIEMILRDIPGSPLVDVNLESIDLSGVPAEQLARVVSCLKTVNLNDTDLTPAQCNCVVEGIHSSETLVDVALEYVNLRGVPAEQLTRAVSRLKTVNLSLTHLTPALCISVVEAIHSSETLVDVALTHVNLSGVPADKLARAVSRLKLVNLSDTDLTPAQCARVLDAIHSSKTLVNVRLWDVNLGQKVSAEMLASVPPYVFYCTCLITKYLSF